MQAITDTSPVAASGGQEGPSRKRNLSIWLRVALGLITFGALFFLLDPSEVIRDANCRAVFLTTRHDSHAELTVAALRAGRHVWVEKPLALSFAQLRAVREALEARPDLHLVVGFNRPFSPLASWLRTTPAPQGPLLRGTPSSRP